MPPGATCMKGTTDAVFVSQFIGSERPRIQENAQKHSYGI